MPLERMSQEEEYRSGTCRMQRRKYTTGGEETVYGVMYKNSSVSCLVCCTRVLSIHDAPGKTFSLSLQNPRTFQKDLFSVPNPSTTQLYHKNLKLH